MPRTQFCGDWDVADPVLRLEELTKRFGGLLVSDGVSMDIMSGELHAIIGPNGAGKTTLINQISGLLAPDAGRIWFMGRDITALPAHARGALGLARSFQVTSVLAGFSALDNVALAVQSRHGSSFRFTGRVRCETVLNEIALALLVETGLADVAQTPAGALSHGERRALEFAMALAMEPKVLLLDEPMAGTGHDEARRLLQLLARLKGRFPIVLIEHDVATVFALADRISVLLYGRLIASGAPAEIRADARVVAAYLGDEME
jgi:branched-chain amino acid transport system ATP-binding protein